MKMLKLPSGQVINMDHVAVVTGGNRTDGPPIVTLSFLPFGLSNTHIIKGADAEAIICWLSRNSEEAAS